MNPIKQKVEQTFVGKTELIASRKRHIPTLFNNVLDTTVLSTMTICQVGAKNKNKFINLKKNNNKNKCYIPKMPNANAKL